MRVQPESAGRHYKLQRIEAQYGRSIEGVLWDLYHRRRMTQQRIADLLGLDRTYVWGLMKHYGIPTRRAAWVMPEEMPPHLQPAASQAERQPEQVGS